MKVKVEPLLLALAALLALLLTARLEIVLLPYLLDLVVELLLRYLQRLAQVLEDLHMVVLFGPVGRVESVVVTDGWLDPGCHQKFRDIGAALLGSDVQRGEP